MRKIIFLTLCAACGLFLFWNYSNSKHFLIQQKAFVSFNEEHENEEQDDINKAIEQEFELTKDPALNRVPKERLIQAEQIRRSRIARWASFRGQAAVSGISWAERGPNNVGGRTRALLYDLNDAVNGYKKVWAGSVGGGIWYTNDITAATPGWTKIDDFLGNLAVTSLAQDATNPQNLYAATGEGWFNADAIQGLGIWKSSNGGANWAQLSATNNSAFYDVQKVLAYTAGGVNYVFACTRSGLQRSTDAGASFTKSLGVGTTPVASVDRIADIERGADGTLYCSAGIFSTDGIYRSSDNGATWTKIYTASGEYRIELACAPTNLDKVYAMVSDNAASPALKKIMVTANATAATPTWTSVTRPSWCDQGSANADMTRGQAWYDLIAAVDPSNENIVYTGGVDLMKTTDGGTTWSQISQWSSGCTSLPTVHADNHALVFKPGSSTELLAGNDGGVYRTTDGGVSFSGRNTSYNVTQYYSCAVHPAANTNYFLAGAQDNGTQKFTSAGLNTTSQASGGDGAFCYIDQDNPNIQITSYTGNNYTVSTNGGASFTYIAGFGNGSFINPTDYDDAANKLYAGNTAGTYLRWNDPATAGTSANTVSVTNFSGASITNVTVSPLTPNRVYFGLNNGSVVRVDNANTGTTKAGVISKTGSGSVTGIAIDPSNEDHILVTYGSFGVTSIYESFNATQSSPTWASVEGNLPDMPVRWVMFDPRNSDWALIATDLGVWSTDNINSGGVTDWQPTNTGLANVRTDMLQYRSSDRTIVAATHGRGLFTAVIPNVSTPDINFSIATAQATEQTTATAGCRNYKDYTVDMTIANAPTGNATVTLSVQAGNTAVEGVDFDFTTNGDFTNITHTVTFASGSGASKTVSIRIYNDAEVESSEAFSLIYSVSGTTDARTGAGFQKYTFAIDDNDVGPTPGGGASSNYTIGSYNANLGNGTAFRSNRLKHRLQTLFTASELQAQGLNVASNITAMTVRVVTKNSTQSFKGFTISMANTSATNLSSGFAGGSFTTVYSGNYSSVVGNNLFNFSSSFAWDGVSNIVLQFCFDNEPGTADASADIMEGNLAPLGTGIRASTYADYTSGVAVGCSLPATFISDSRINATFTSMPNGNAIETALNATRSEYTANTGTFYFYNGSNILNSITGASSNLSCVTTTLLEAGNTWQTFSGGQRSQKVFTITPSINSGSTYTVGLYFTAVELAGKVPSSLKIAKTTSPTMAGANASNTLLKTTTVTAFGTGYLFTATFTGFSNFFLVDAGVVLPVTLLNFDGYLNNNSALLKWSTSSEQNLKNFEIEKSTDGFSYYKIGLVNAAGNSSAKIDYSFRDNTLGGVNYYRLRMNDNDGRNKLSQVVLLRYNDATQNIWIVNNPFNNYIDMRFANPGTQVKLQLINTEGAMIAEKTMASPQGQMRWNLSNNVSKGNYILKAIVDGQPFTTKLVKQ